MRVAKSFLSITLSAGIAWSALGAGHGKVVSAEEFAGRYVLVKQLNDRDGWKRECPSEIEVRLEKWLILETTQSGPLRGPKSVLSIPRISTGRYFASCLAKGSGSSQCAGQPEVGDHLHFELEDGFGAFLRNDGTSAGGYSAVELSRWRRSGNTVYRRLRRSEGGCYVFCSSSSWNVHEKLELKYRAGRKILRLEAKDKVIADHRWQYDDLRCEYGQSH